MNKKTIVLIEDNLDDELLTIRALKKNNISNEIVVFRDGEEALNWILGRNDYANKSSDNLPVFILLDLQIPKIDGLEILKHVKSDELMKKVPVIILTTSTEEMDIEESYKLHANSYIRKPVDYEEFTSLIKSLSDYWINLNRTHL